MGTHERQQEDTGELEAKAGEVGWVGFRRRAQLCEAQMEAELVQVPSLISASVSSSVEQVRQHLYSARLSADEMKRCT